MIHNFTIAYLRGNSLQYIVDSLFNIAKQFENMNNNKKLLDINNNKLFDILIEEAYKKVL